MNVNMIIEKHGLNPELLSRLLGVHPTSVYRWKQEKDVEPDGLAYALLLHLRDSKPNPRVKELLVLGRVLDALALVLRDLSPR
jgi:hypothetical protein